MNESDVLGSEAKFCQMNERVLLAVLESDEGNLLCHPDRISKNSECLTCKKTPVFQECRLFDLVLKWGRYQCRIRGLDETPENLKTILEPFLPFIRFPTMTTDQLILSVYPTKLFDDSTFLSIILDSQNTASGRPANASRFARVKRRAFIGSNIKRVEPPSASLFGSRQPSSSGTYFGAAVNSQQPKSSCSNF
uniref:Uncharacterized protein n=1 Tax=Panagrolaimus sp. JU765 TaxID=591449 RepID=A0AC34PZG2_9BILA